MEEVFLRFPHLSENIFDLLDNKSLADCKEVSKSWHFYLAAQKFLQKRIIKANLTKLEGTIEMVQSIIGPMVCGYCMASFTNKPILDDHMFQYHYRVRVYWPGNDKKYRKKRKLCKHN